MLVCASLEVASVDEGTVDCLYGPHSLFPLGVGDVSSHTGALQGGREETGHGGSEEVGPSLVRQSQPNGCALYVH